MLLTQYQKIKREIAGQFHKMDLTLFTSQKDGVTFPVRVTPNARKNQIGDIMLDSQERKVLKIGVTKVPEDGKANDAVIALLSTAWQLKKSQIKIMQGASSRNKIVHILGNSEELLKHLEARL